MAAPVCFRARRRVFSPPAVGSSTERAGASLALFAADMSAPQPPKPPAKPPKPPTKSAASENPPDVKSVAFTIDAGTGHVDRIEVIDRDGVRHELNGKERADLVKEAGPTLETIFEETFLAGIDSVLGDGAREEEEPETEVEKALVRGLLQPMIQRSAARRLLGREVLRKAVMRALIQDASTPPPSAAGPGPEGMPAGA